MDYKFKRALGISFVLYLSTFVVGIVSGIISGQDMSSMETISDSFWYVGMVAAVVLTALYSLWYFKNPALKPSIKSGLYFGLTAVAFGFLADLFFFTLGNMQGANVDLMAYYGDYRFWVILVLVIGTAKLVGYLKGRKSV